MRESIEKPVLKKDCTVYRKDSNGFRFEYIDQVGGDNKLMTTFKSVLRYQFSIS